MLRKLPLVAWRTAVNLPSVWEHHEILWPTLEDCHRTTEELVDTMGESWSSCQWILTEELRVKKDAARFVPRLFAEDQKQLRLIAFVNWKNSRKLIQTLFLLLFYSFSFFFRRSSLVAKSDAIEFANVEEMRKKNDGAIKRHHFSSIPEMFPTVEMCLNRLLQMKNNFMAINM